MKVALAQIDLWVGDLEGNVARCLDAVQCAADQGADLVVLPELAITGPFPRDLLLDTSFVAAASEALEDLATRLKEAPTVIVGCARAQGAALVKGVAGLERGSIAGFVGQRRLRDDDVFHESRWFAPWLGARTLVTSSGVLSIVDAHSLDGRETVEAAVDAEAEIALATAALPYEPGAHAVRIARARARRRALAFVNACGSQDELVLEGRSFAVDRRGNVVAVLPLAREEVRVVDLDLAAAEAGDAAEEAAWEDEVATTIECGIRGFLEKNRIQTAFVGLSGGIDSSLVATLAARALGANRVQGVAMPSRFSDPRSLECARELARGLGIELDVVPIGALHAAAEEALGDRAEGVAGENLQARLRMIVLMACVNSRGGVVLNTSNKTELAVGYGTLYGDLAGGLSPIGDLTKPQVYRLARYLNRTWRSVIPEFVLTRPPSAELRADQVDPFDYERLGPELERLVRENRSNASLARSEHKRRQAAPILRVSSKAFGSGRLFPMTRR